MESVLMGNPGGADVDMGISKYVHQRMRSVLIHVSLSFG
jgi:hypothetical protein